MKNFLVVSINLFLYKLAFKMRNTPRNHHSRTRYTFVIDKTFQPSSFERVRKSICVSGSVVKCFTLVTPILTYFVMLLSRTLENPTSSGLNMVILNFCQQYIYLVIAYQHYFASAESYSSTLELVCFRVCFVGKSESGRVKLFFHYKERK